MIVHEPLIVEVTQEDIDRGVPGSRCWCPVARAIKRVLAGPKMGSVIPDLPVTVANYRVEIDGGRADLPSAAVEFIMAFDKGFPVAPFSFKLE